MSASEPAPLTSERPETAQGRGDGRSPTPPRYWRAPLDIERMQIPRGEVRIIVDRCKGCGFCVEYCPKDVLVLSDAFNRKGYHPPTALKEEACINCGLCEMICPDFAIYSVPAAQRAGGTGVGTQASENRIPSGADAAARVGRTTGES